MNFAFIRKTLASLFSQARPPDQRHVLGRRGERAAARYLRRRGHRILARNFRCVAGEIDLICADGDTLVFVEVKARSTDQAAHPHEGFRKPQWRRVANAARFYVMQRSAQQLPCRFDLITIVWPPGGRARIEHFADAFQPVHA